MKDSTERNPITTSSDADIGHISTGNDSLTENDTVLYFRRATENQLESNSSKTNAMHIIDASQTILFTASSLKRTILRCLSCIGNDSIHTAFSSILHRLKATTSRLMAILDTVEKKSTADTLQELIQTTSLCITVLKELCLTLKSKLLMLVQGLDAKFSRNLLMNLYSATVDIKAAWETISPFMNVPPITTLPSSILLNNNNTSHNHNSHRSQGSSNSSSINSNDTTMSHKPKIVSTHSAPTHRNRSHSELTSNSLLTPPLSSPGVNGDNNQLYGNLKNAITGSLHVINTIRQTIDDTLNDDISDSLTRKLHDLLRQTQVAADFSNRLDKNLSMLIPSNKEENVANRMESSRKIWEDTSIYLKAIVNVMTSVRSISTEEDFLWPRQVKQGCLNVTRMTTEVAKSWNNHSTFTEDGFFLGRGTNTNEQSPTGSIGGYTSPTSRHNP